MLLYQLLALNIDIIENIENSYKNNKFKILSPTCRKQFDPADG